MFARLNDELFCVEYDAFPFFNDDLVFQRNRCILGRSSWTMLSSGEKMAWCWCVPIPCTYAGLIDASKTNAPSKADKGKAVAQEPTTSKPKSKQN